MITTSLTPITREIKGYEFIALDSEGSGALGDFKLAVTFDKDGAHVFRDREQLKRWLFKSTNLGKLIIAANLEYDYAVCFQPFTEEYEITLSARRWIKAVRKDSAKHAWTAFDIQRVAPLSVQEMGEIVGLPKYATPPALTGARMYDVPEWSCPAHGRLWCIECYCVRDAEIVYRFSNQFQDTLNHLGGEMHYTAASCAMDLFRRRYLKQEIAPTFPEKNALARACYYGGRVEAYRVGTLYDVNAYDFNSLYPSVMRDVLVGQPDTYRRVEMVANPYQYLDHFGQLFGTVALPERFTGVLPFRSNSKLYFPTGTVKGSWTLSELRYACEHGARILSADAIIYASRTLSLFGDFVDTLYKLRLAYKADNRADQIVVKLMLNSLYGKFGQHDEGGLTTLLMPSGKYRLEDYAQDEPASVVGREVFLREISAHAQPPHINVLWAAEITSQARVKLLNSLSASDDEIVYCDTDSIHTRGNLPTDTKLGALKLEHHLLRATYFAPKEYGGQDESGEFIYRAKGIPPAYRSEYLYEGAVEFNQPIRTMSAIRRGKRIAEWVSVQKARRTDAMNRKHKRIRNYNKGQITTYPFDVDEIV